MKVKDLKLALDQYDDGDLIGIFISLGTGYRIDKGQIKPCEHDDAIYEIKSIEKDDNTSMAIFKLE